MAVIEKDVTEELLQYYSSCWTKRISEGHNASSLAIHQGYAAQNEGDYERAKVKMNAFLSEQLLDLEPDAKLLDVGCGVGGTAFYLSEQNPSLQITGINISQEQISLASELASLRNSNMVDFQVSDYCNTGLSDASFDAVYGIESICHSDDKRSFSREMARLLKTGGKLVILDYFMGRPTVNAEEESVLEQFCNGWYIPDLYRNFDDYLAEFDFLNIEFQDISLKVQASVEISSTKAQTKVLGLVNGTPSLMENHLNACVALQSLFNLGIVKYGLLTATRS